MYNCCMEELEARQALARANAVQQITDVALEPHRPEDILPAMLARMRSVLASEAVTVFERDGDGLVVAASTASPSEGRRPGPLARQVAADRAPAHLGAVMAAPLISDGDVLGVLEISGGEHDLELLTAIARRTAAVVTRSALESRRQTIVAEAVPEPLLVFDAGGTVRLANQRADSFFGYEPGALTGIRADDLLAQSLQTDYANAREAFIADPEPRSGISVTVRRQDGTEHGVEISVTPIREDEDLLVAVTVSHTAAQRRLEAQLRQAQKLESIGRLATGVAHDFNNALTSINGYAHLTLSRLKPDDPSHGDVRQIVSATEHAGRLVTQLQSFSRGERLEVDVIDLNQSVRDVGRLLRVVLGERIDLDLRLGGRLPGVEANVGALEQVVMQLALNARDAMPDGGQLTIETSASDGPTGRWVQLRCADTGVGMDEATRLRAFEPFFTTKAGGESSGLGLTTVYAFAGRFRGTIDLESERGAGTVVRLQLPASSTSAEGFATDRPAGLGTVLMVEDDESLRTVVDRILTDEGYRVLTAASGEEALELAAQEPGPIDLLVSDVVLGGMTGPELATKLKARRSGMKTLLMSGYPGMPIGPVDDFLRKPFSPFELARRIRRVLRP